MSKIYKYQSDIDNISKVCNCPETTFFSFNQKEAYRFVFEDSEHPNNFSPPLKINPKRYLTKDDIEKCQALGLSLYGKKSGAIEKFEELSLNFKKIKQVIGTHIAFGIITDDDGHITVEDEITHFDMYEFENSEINKKFEIIEEL